MLQTREVILKEINNNEKDVEYVLFVGRRTAGGISPWIFAPERGE
ncbi:MAG: hypothetical protein ACLUD0_07035 [Eubacterium ramulus]